MKIYSHFAAMLCAVMVMVASCQAATIIITAPTSNANTNGPNFTCDVTVTATVTLAQGESFYGGAKLTVTQANGPTKTYDMNVAQTTCTFVLDTLYLSNGLYSLVAQCNILQGGYPPRGSTIYSDPVRITTRNGWKIIDDPAKTYSKVTAPAEGTVIRTGNVLTIHSDHKVTFQRLESCAPPYNVGYSFDHYTTWTNVLNATDPRQQTFVEGTGTADMETHFEFRTLDSAPNIAGGNTGFYAVIAETFFPPDRNTPSPGPLVATDSKNWEHRSPLAP